MDFKSKTALITGASVGIGRACALLLAKSGADVAVMDYDPSTLAALENELRAYPVRVLAYVCDVSDQKQVKEAVADILSQWGRVDILVNNAGIWRAWCPFVDTTFEDWTHYWNVNVMGTVYCTQAVLPNMLAQGYGRIVNVSSVAAVYGNANMVPYSATKGALLSMTRALAKEVAEKGVTVNSVSPGSVSPSEESDITYTQPSPLSFMGRTGSDEENANAILFLCSNEASYISGQNLQVDGCRKKQ